MIGAVTTPIRGVAVDDGHGGTQPLFAPPGLRLGALQTGATFYAGSLADAAVYDTDLLASIVAAHFSARQATP
jgi:hypothetical protein